MRVDAHHHVWDLAVRDQPWTAELAPLRRSFAFDELRPDLRRAGIDATVLVQTVPVAEETREFLALQAATPEIVGVVGWVDLPDPAVADRIAALAAGPGRLVGVRHHVEDEPADHLARPDVRRGIAAVGAAGLVYDLLLTPAHLPAAIDLVATQPGTRFVLDHGAKPRIAAGELDPWAERIRQLSAHPNVAVKLSGLAREAGPGWTVERLRPFAQVLLDAFTPDRVMYGSDWPVCLLTGSYPQVHDAVAELVAGLSAAERATVAGGTAVRWYGLAEPSHASTTYEACPR